MCILEPRGIRLVYLVLEVNLLGYELSLCFIIGLGNLQLGLLRVDWANISIVTCIYKSYLTRIL